MKQEIDRPLPSYIDPRWKIGIVASTYHKEHIDAMAEGARELLVEAGVKPENVFLYGAPGSFEIPVIGSALAKAGKVDALMGFGIIVQGETHHARLLAESVTQAMMDIQVLYAMPFAYEVLYVNELSQAIDRTKGQYNKGREAAYAVLHSLAELHRIRTEGH